MNPRYVLSIILLLIVVLFGSSLLISNKPVYIDYKIKNFTTMLNVDNDLVYVINIISDLNGSKTITAKKCESSEKTQTISIGQEIKIKYVNNKPIDIINLQCESVNFLD